MKKLSLFAAATLGALTLASTGLAADDISREDKEFLKNAGELGMTEVQLGQLAVAKATDPELKALGARLVADHSASNEELVALALQKGGPVDLAELELSIFRATRIFARRQRTWLRDQPIEWLPPGSTKL